MGAGYYEGASLGYGCSQLMARAGRAESLRLLETAFDAGVTHYDVARLYGYGAAESAVGDFIAGKRDRVTVATKLGLLPPRGGRALGLLKAGARRAVAVAPRLRGAVRGAAARTVRPGRFGVADARASLETSLAELRTDYVDLLLLHECRPEDVTDELLGFLDACVEEGRARAVGIATGPRASADILAARPRAAGAVQVENGVTARTSEAHPELWRARVLTHSALAGLGALHDHVSSSPETAGSWSAALQEDCTERATLGRLMLAWACFANPGGTVLFSSRSPEHIRANARLDLSPARRDQVERFAALVARELPVQPARISSTSGSTPSSSRTDSAPSQDSSGRVDRTGA